MLGVFFPVSRWLASISPGLTPSDAAVKLNQALSYPITGKVLFRDGEKAWIATPAELGMVFDPSSSAVTAYSLGRSGGLFGALIGSDPRRR